MFYVINILTLDIASVIKECGKTEYFVIGWCLCLLFDAIVYYWMVNPIVLCWITKSSNDEVQDNQHQIWLNHCHIDWNAETISR